eukprot:CAMPEP_0170223976 /NCGR_PEP_ID=MMETSP0116_2-20130129/11689_1 /TAXON_ID=400756 /ORGANISM="Durinskia baltica, Strain CSIRO CS-38" /LENGTH=363 /DNA_ID=CAMNT_0010474681 /DNA_START=52 /DNA_END=1143 /DNA_ORIENTATION=-
MMRGDRALGRKLGRLATTLAVVASVGVAQQYDCNALMEWELWPDVQKRFCCDHGGHGCDPWDCSYQLSTHAISWLPTKGEWCCQHRALGCAPQFDCNAGWSNWEAGWSKPKKEWCCDKYGKACDPFDCNVGNSDRWPQSKKDYCCSKNGQGCPTTTTVPFDCNAGWANWEAGWSAPKKEWCCERYGKACDPFDCNFANPDMWPQSKKDYCCSKAGKGCYDCNSAVEHWENAWSSKKKEYCCQHGGKGCDRFDCDLDLANADNSWCPERRDWCCAQYHKGCDEGATYHVLAELSRGHAGEELAGVARAPVGIALFAAVIPLAAVSWGVAAWRQRRERLRGRLLGQVREEAGDIHARMFMANDVE